MQRDLTDFEKTFTCGGENQVNEWPKNQTSEAYERYLKSISWMPKAISEIEKYIGDSEGYWCYEIEKIINRHREGNK